jgi:PHD/YefM family antitoxin component YafN of YafNO toxin-antitoxin module
MTLREQFCAFTSYAKSQEDSSMKSAHKIRYITDEQGKKQSVILPVETYQAILEDIQDLVTIAERKKEKSISLAEFKKGLRKDGLI